MGSWLPAMLLRLMVLGHLMSLLAGQHFSMNKCTHECPPLRSTRQLQNRLLKSYTKTAPSCRVQAVIFITIKNRTLCADPNEKWVREAIQYLDNVSAAAAATQKQAPGKENGGMFEKLTGENGPPTTQVPGGGSTGPATLLVPGATSAPVPTSASPSPSPTPAFPEEEAALETSPGLPTSPAGSSESFPGPLLVGSTSSMVGGSSPDPLLASQGTETSSTEALSATMTPPPESSDSGSLAAGRMSDETPAMSHPREEGSGRLKDPSEPGEERDFSTENPIISEEMSTVFTLTNPFSKLAVDNTDGHSPASLPASESLSSGLSGRTNLPSKAETLPHVTADPQKLKLAITPIPDSPQAATRRQAFGLLAFLGFLFCLGVAMFAYQSLQSCPRRMAGEVVEGLRYIPRSCGSNSYVLVPV
ncbi:fractalkine [Sarcophilus harrisii]|uniref:C-X3-C motif chemokine ligand 1 n=1 Tax=Sarcophilus harrisii TaxID=9305 RepID=G3WQJ0_SARHA|nr:fractalkine [Sarcophilus harrisii]